MAQETLEEAALRFYPKVITDPYNPSEDLLKEERTIFIEGAKYQQERSYSEEEVYNLLLKHQSDYRSAVRNTSPLNWSFDIKKWFEQFKKK